jgi:predicted Zn-dependent peptidase
MGTDNGNHSRAIALVNKELERLRKVPLGMMQLSQAKKQLIGQIAIANEYNLNRLLSVGKTFLHDGRVSSLKETRERIENISSADIINVAGEILATEGMSMLVFRNRV